MARRADQAADAAAASAAIRPVPLLRQQHSDAHHRAWPSSPPWHGVPIKRPTPLLLLQHYGRCRCCFSSIPTPITGRGRRRLHGTACRPSGQWRRCLRSGRCRCCFCSIPTPLTGRGRRRLHGTACRPSGRGRCCFHSITAGAAAASAAFQPCGPSCRRRLHGTACRSSGRRRCCLCSITAGAAAASAAFRPAARTTPRVSPAPAA
jgi:hypothetical protein